MKTNLKSTIELTENGSMIYHISNRLLQTRPTDWVDLFETFSLLLLATVWYCNNWNMFLCFYIAILQLMRAKFQTFAYNSKTV